MLGVFALLVLLWAGVPAMVFGSAWAADATTTAFIGQGVLLLTGVLDWEDVLKEKSAWDTIVWFSALVMMATFLNKLGLIGWFSTSFAPSGAAKSTRILSLAFSLDRSYTPSPTWTRPLRPSAARNRSVRAWESTMITEYTAGCGA